MFLSLAFSQNLKKMNKYKQLAREEGKEGLREAECTKRKVLYHGHTHTHIH